MKRVSFRLSLIAFILLLSSCGNGAASPVPSQSESSRMDKSVGSVFSELQPESSEEEPEPSGFLLPEAVRIIKADYDAIELATYDVFRHPSAPPADENGLFYGAEKDGLWGLIDENGTEVLPCESKRAPSLCEFGEWLWWGSEDSLEKLSGSVEEKTGRPFCVAHGGYARWFIAEEPGDVPGILWKLEGCTAVYPAEEEDLLGTNPFPFSTVLWSAGRRNPCARRTTLSGITPEPTGRCFFRKKSSSRWAGSGANSWLRYRKTGNGRMSERTGPSRPTFCMTAALEAAGSMTGKPANTGRLLPALPTISGRGRLRFSGTGNGAF